MNTNWGKNLKLRGKSSRPFFLDSRILVTKCIWSRPEMWVNVCFINNPKSSFALLKYFGWAGGGRGKIFAKIFAERKWDHLCGMPKCRWVGIRGQFLDGIFAWWVIRDRSALRLVKWICVSRGDLLEGNWSWKRMMMIYFGGDWE